MVPFCFVPFSIIHWMPFRNRKESKNETLPEKCETAKDKKHRKYTKQMFEMIFVFAFFAFSKKVVKMDLYDILWETDTVLRWGIIVLRSFFVEHGSLVLFSIINHSNDGISTILCMKMRILYGNYCRYKMKEE